MVGFVTFIAGGEGGAVEAFLDNAQLTKTGCYIQEVLVGGVALGTSGE